MRSVATSAVFFAVLASATPARAHRSRPTREMVVQVDRDGVAALWRVELTGSEAARVVAFYDVDRNGRLIGAEDRAAAAFVLGKALKRVELRWNAAPLLLARVEARLEASGETLVAVGLVELLRPAADHAGTLSVRVDGGDTTVDVQAVAPWLLAKVGRGGLRDDGRALAAPLVMAAGERLDVRVRGAP